MPCFELKVYAADQVAGTLSRDVNGIDDKLYPGYKKLINDLKAIHPEYTFLIFFTKVTIICCLFINWSS